MHVLAPDRSNECRSCDCSEGRAVGSHPTALYRAPWHEGFATDAGSDIKPKGPAPSSQRAYTYVENCQLSTGCWMAMMPRVQGTLWEPCLLGTNICCRLPFTFTSSENRPDQTHKRAAKRCRVPDRVIPRTTTRDGGNATRMLDARTSCVQGGPNIPKLH